ncbi:hypothetical protein N0V93_007946 [Gnomoniopsis smithogilvyi]|uniref:Uncharacterized protein n=1 Tax=Gnomoniopsis smithogilvyi TaxID=1191159 RepID=A0A9W8YP37_9PEZI|nr:hypothetical protein N0V93_007946 [Gnomoniopsis smithogilvyi]
MVFWMNALIRVLYATEDYIVGQILRSPGFHHAVRRIHRRVQDHKYGRDPNEPLRPGEATELGGSKDNGGFMKHFLEELRNQARGRPTDVPPPPRGPQQPRK